MSMVALETPLMVLFFSNKLLRTDEFEAMSGFICKSDPESHDKLNNLLKDINLIKR